MGTPTLDVGSNKFWTKETCPLARMMKKESNDSLSTVGNTEAFEGELRMQSILATAPELKYKEFVA